MRHFQVISANLLWLSILLQGCLSETSLSQVYRADDPTRNDGIVTGGTAVVVLGAHFTHDTQVTIDGNLLLNKNVTSSSSITGRIPPGNQVGGVMVEVGGRYGHDSLADGWVYSPESVTIASVSPEVGDTAGGTPVTIVGTGFAPGTIIEFHTSPIGTLHNTVIHDSTRITGETPPSLPADQEQMVDVVVRNSFGNDTLVQGFEFRTCADPTLPLAIDSARPSHGPVTGGTRVTLPGTGLTTGTLVTFGGKPGSNVDHTGSPCSLSVETPPGDFPGPVDVTVLTATDSYTLADGFSYTAMGISSVSPAQGPITGGTNVTITGSGFVDPTGVNFGGVPAVSGLYININTYVVVTPPAALPGPVDVTVTNFNGTDTLQDGFVYLPVGLDSIEPNFSTLAGGIPVFIRGSGLNGTTRVLLGENELQSLAVTSDGMEITGIVPPGSAPGPVDVHVETVSYGTATLSTGFVYDPGPPRVWIVAPNYDSLKGGGSAMIVGDNLTTAPLLVDITFDGGGGGEDGVAGNLPATVTRIINVRTMMVTIPAKPDGVLEVVEVGASNGIGTTSTPDSFAYAEWRSPGPLGGFVVALEIDPADPDIVYVGINGLGVGSTGGLFRSTDAGASWERREVGLSDTNVTALSVAAAPPMTLYAGTPSGLFVTRDEGLTWRAAGTLPLSDGLLSGIPVFSTAVDPADGDRVYVGSDGSTLYRSDDGGATVASTSLVGPGNVEVAAIALSPWGAVFCGTGGAGVYQSLDRGGTWSPRNSGLTNPYVLSLEADPLVPNRIYAGTVGDGVFVYDDASELWSPGGLLTAAPTPAVYDLEADLTIPDRVWAAADDVGGLASGVWFSDDGGLSWAEMSTGLEDAGADAEMRSIAVHPSNSDVLYAGGLSRVFKTVDGAASWAVSDRWIANTNVRAVVKNTSGAATFAGTFGSGVYGSSDEGLSWTASNGIPPTSLTATRVQALSLAETSGVLYAGTSDGGVFMSADMGLTWSAENGGLLTNEARNISALAVNPELENQVYLGTTEVGLYATMQGGTLGMQWGYEAGDPILGPCTEQKIRSLAVSETILRYRSPSADPDIPQTGYPVQVVLIGTNGDGLYLSSDALYSCQRYIQGLDSMDVRSLFVGVEQIIDPEFPLRFADNLFVYAGTGGAGVFRGSLDIRIEMSPFVPGEYRAVVKGILWVPRNEGLTNPFVHSIAVDPVQPTNVFAGTDGGGVFVTGSSGGFWQLLNPGSTLTNPTVNGLGLVLDNCTLCTTVLAGTGGGGVNRIRILKQ